MVQARYAALEAGHAQRGRAEGILAAAGKLFGLMEAYPQIKSDRAFIELHRSWSETEARIADARAQYNQAVGHYNSLLRQVPPNLIGAMFGFREARFFELSPADEPDVRKPPSM